MHYMCCWHMRGKNQKSNTLSASAIEKPLTFPLHTAASRFLSCACTMYLTIAGISEGESTAHTSSVPLALLLIFPLPSTETHSCPSTLRALLALRRFSSRVLYLTHALNCSTCYDRQNRPTGQWNACDVAAFEAPQIE